MNQGCTSPGHIYGGGLRDASALISSDGSFKIDFDYHGTVGNDLATGHFTLTGHFTGPAATDTLQVTANFTADGTAYSCGSGLPDLGREPGRVDALTLSRR